MRRPLPCTWARPSVFGLVGFSLAFLLTSPSQGQDSSGTSAPLARYVPKDDISFYFEFDGLDAHADAWRKTAAYKILNNTPTGGMLEEVLTQIVDKVPSYGAKPHRTGAEVVSLLKHVAKSGFVVAGIMNPAEPNKRASIVVFRDGYKDKTARAIIARSISEMYAPNTKPQQVVRADHKVISGTTATGGGFAWWVEDSKKDDIVMVFPKLEAADIFLETLDGKRPNAIELPQRAELRSSENGFVPIGLAFVDAGLLKSDKIPAALGLSEIKKLDYRLGFQDDALMTITRISSPSPRKGVLALLDGPTFDKGKLPPIPENVSGFSVASLDLKATYDNLISLGKMVKPDIEETVNQTLDLIKTKPKFRLKEDLLAHLGPKVAWYILPSKASTAAPAPSAMPSMIGMMMASAGIDQIPKLAVVFDIDDPKTFGKVLDEVMAATNRELKAQAAKKMAEAVPAATGGNTPGGGNAGGGGGRTRGGTAPSIQFQLMPGDTKTYVLSVPPELSSQIPGGLRPTIRVGPKHAVLAVSADVARLALEAKGSWAAPNDLGVAFQKLSSKLKLLEVDDPRDTLPAILAAFPGKVQTGINTAMLSMMPGAPPAGTPPPAVANSAPNPMAGLVAGAGPTSLGPGGPSGVPGMDRPGPGRGGNPTGPNVPGGPSGTPPGGPSTVVIQVDAAKMPTADAIKALLFPSIYTVEVLDDDIRIVSREAFPAIGDPSKASMIAGMVRSQFMPGMPGMPPPPALPGVAGPGTTPPASVPGEGKAGEGKAGETPTKNSGRGRRGPD